MGKVRVFANFCPQLYFLVQFQIIDNDINPYVDEWEAAEQFPSHEVFKKLGDAGFLGITRPVGKDM